MEMRTWAGRKWPSRGESIGHPIPEIDIDPEMLIYVGRLKGAGFIWIGKRKDLPEYLTKTPVEMLYPRETGYKGMILLLGPGLPKQKGERNVWNWNEFDKTIPPHDSPDAVNPEAAESLFIATAQDAARNYRNLLNRGLRNLEDPHNLSEVERMIRLAKRRKEFDFFHGTSMGDYILTRIDDEIRVKARTPKWESLTPDKKQRVMRKEMKKLRMERVKEKEDALYAHIKGRSIR